VGKTVRTHDDDEDFGEDFHIVEFKPKHEKHLKISKTSKARKADKWDRAAIKPIDNTSYSFRDGDE
jgi:hypothetical protein